MAPRHFRSHRPEEGCDPKQRTLVAQDWQSAVSPAGSRPGRRRIVCVGTINAQRVANPRYSRLPVCATSPAVPATSDHTPGVSARCRPLPTRRRAPSDGWSRASMKPSDNSRQPSAKSSHGSRSMTKKPSAVFLRNTSSVPTRNSSGRRMAWLRPFMNTLAAVMLGPYRPVYHTASRDADRGRTVASGEQRLRLRERFAELRGVLAAAAGVVGLAAALAADDRRDGLDDLPGLRLRGEVG